MIFLSKKILNEYAEIHLFPYLQKIRGFLLSMVTKIEPNDESDGYLLKDGIDKC